MRGNPEIQVEWANPLVAKAVGDTREAAEVTAREARAPSMVTVEAEEDSRHAHKIDEEVRRRGLFSAVDSFFLSSLPWRSPLRRRWRLQLKARLRD